MEKAERIDRVRNSLTSADEVVARFPEIDGIEDEGIRTATIQFFLQYCPDYFWERASSASGKYHPPDERGEHGTWLHTKRVFVEYVNASESYVEAGQLSEEEQDAGKAAALLHDTFNYGWPSDNNTMTVQNHDVIAAALAKEVDGIPEETVFLINSHMGPWGEGKIPATQHEWVFHQSDKSAAKSSHRPDVVLNGGTIEEAFPHLSGDISLEDIT